MIQFVSLLVTLAIEGAGMAVLASLLPGWRPRWHDALAAAILLNVVSHTIFWYALPLVPLAPDQALPLAEWIVILAEGAVYAATVARPVWTGWFVSLVLNYASWVLSTYLWR